MNIAPIAPTLLAAFTLSLMALGAGCATNPNTAAHQTHKTDPTVQTNRTPATQPTPATIATELQPLQGKWEGAMVGDSANLKITITIAGDSLHFHRDANFWFKTIFTLPAGKNPQELHATIKDCPPPSESVGKVVVALFKIENETLTLAAMGDDGEGAARTFESPGLTRYELRKVQPH